MLWITFPVVGDSHHEHLGEDQRLSRAAAAPEDDVLRPGRPPSEQPPHAQLQLRDLMRRRSKPSETLACNVCLFLLRILRMKSTEVN